ERDLTEAAQRRLDARLALAHLRGVAAELLAERDRDSVHPVRAPALHDVVELLRLATEGGRELVERGQQVVRELVERREVHGGREDVVGALAHVDVVIRVHAFAGERRDDLVRVHVRRRARAGLEHVDRELVVELAACDAIAGRSDALRLLVVEQAQLGVHARRGGLDAAQPARDRDGDRLPGHGEVGDRLARLAAPKLLCGVRLGHEVEVSRRPVSNSLSQAVSFTRGRPRGSPAARSAASIACQPSYSTKCAPFSRSSSSSDPPPPWRASLPAAASASSCSTVSTASFLFVPMTPLGPRLIQPAQYVRSAPTTRPASFGITQARSSNGTPGSGTPRYPTLRSTRPHSSVSFSPVGRATILPFSSTSSFFTISIASTLSSPRIATGETRKRSAIRRGLPSGRFAAYSRRMSTLRRARSRSCSSAASLAASSTRSAGSTITSAPASSPSSCSSGGVNAACTGPRRPSITISSSGDATIASIASSVVSVVASSSAVSASIRTQSIATLPFPTTTTRFVSRSNSWCWKSGWPLYQATNAVAGQEPGRSSPGMPSERSVCAP